ncbi:Non-specific serine/threonine protein kinase [Bertholletia excelsa]
MAWPIILLVVLQYYVFVIATAAPSSIFNLSSNLPSTWHNNDSLNLNVGRTSEVFRAILMRKKSIGFACGFYGANSSYSFSVVLVGGSRPEVVWSANPKQPVKENATLELTGGEGLVLRDSNGTRIWTTNITGKPVAGFNMTELGNLVVFATGGEIVWQSFDHPTDTLLSGQRLYENHRLSSGLYYATLLDSGFAAYTQVDKGDPQMYYHLVPEGGSVVPSGGQYYPELLTGGFLVNLGTSRMLNQTQSSLDSFIEYVRIGDDGTLKLYRKLISHASEVISNRYNNSIGQSEFDMVSQDFGQCQLPRVCGELGICKDGQCRCPQDSDDGHYYKSDGFEGCQKLSCESHASFTMLVVPNLTYFNLIDSDAVVPNITDSEKCKQACQNNCTCSAAFFRFGRNTAEGFCYMPSEVLSLRNGRLPSYNFSSVAFIKVKNPSDGWNLIGIIVGWRWSSAALGILLTLISLLTKCGKTSTTEEEEDYAIRLVPGMPVRFSLEVLRVATRDFKERVGGGGFGSVFKGTLQDGTLIAVKRLHRLGREMREFLAEVETIGSIHHYNLVRLIGFCAEKSSYLLVYEYMINGSLDNWIFYREQQRCLDWETRKKIILDIAKGLAYLHEECRQRIIHHDIKPQNILLDENFSAKISDFGLSRLIDRKESHVLTTLRGTPGYIGPECGHSKITVKIDVYSFGIVLLEIVCGRRNLDGTQSESSKHLLWLLQKKAEENQLHDILENLDERWNHKEEKERYIRIAAWCLQNDPDTRPLMSTVVKVLEGVMEVDPNISYKFVHAMGMVYPPKANEIPSQLPQASVLSNPR